ncbi:hypothetical protein ACFQGT_10805 [Natrialbaceae archaeon GCM10025810]|uniref:DUF7344 domain-containing protein n=1 Tax=Halovalidus salilacus TaxID=3075124 RepID=UPI003613892E
MGLGDTVSSADERDRAESSPSTTVDPKPLSRDEVFHILQTRRRRDVLRYLREADGPVELRDLAEQVAAWEHGTTVDGLSSGQRQRVYISLYQSHLPKLDNRGIVAYDKDRGIVERRPRAAELDRYLEDSVGDERSDPWPRRYAGVVVASGAFVGASAIEVTPLSGSVTASLVLAAFTAVTIGHVLDRGL